MTKPTYEELAERLLWLADRITRHNPATDLADAKEILEAREMALAAVEPVDDWEVGLRRVLAQTATLRVKARTPAEAERNARKAATEATWGTLPTTEMEITVDFTEQVD